MDELHGQAEIVGKLLGSVDQFTLDFDAASVKVEHGGQTGHHAEAAAPFTEQPARCGVGSQITQEGIDHAKVTGHKAGNMAGKLKPPDAPPGFAQKGTDIAGHGGFTH